MELIRLLHDVCDIINDFFEKTSSSYKLNLYIYLTNKLCGYKFTFYYEYYIDYYIDNHNIIYTFIQNSISLRAKYIERTTKLL